MVCWISTTDRVEPFKQGGLETALQDRPDDKAVAGDLLRLRTSVLPAVLMRGSHPTGRESGSSMLLKALSPAPGCVATGTLGEIRSTINGDFALGRKQYQAPVVAVVRRRVSPGRSGRPCKKKGTETLRLFGQE